MLKDIKNLTQTYCPFCFNKLTFHHSKTKIPHGICYTIKGNFYKRDIRKTEKASNINFSYSDNLLVKKVSSISLKKNTIPSVRLKLKNKMAKVMYMSEYSKESSYTAWECTNKDCYYYKFIDDIEYDYTGK